MGASQSMSKGATWEAENTSRALFRAVGGEGVDDFLKVVKWGEGLSHYMGGSGESAIVGWWG